MNAEEVKMTPSGETAQVDQRGSAAGSQPTDCAFEIKCPPSLAPVRCHAVEIGGARASFEIDSAPNHCAGMNRLAAKICLKGRKFSDFAVSCELKSR